MDIFKLAMEREKQMELYYRKLAENCQQKSIKIVLERLAEQEGDHFSGIKKWAFRLAKPHESNLIKKNQNILSEITENTSKIDLTENQVELYAKARSYEKESENFYRELEKLAETKEQKEIFKALADEEHKHYLVLDELVEYTATPEKWIEAAEFGQLRNY